MPRNFSDCSNSSKTSPHMNRNKNYAGITRSWIAGVEPDCRYVQSLPGQRLRRAARRIEAAINHMLQHVNKPLRVSTLSAIAGVSVSHFFPLFKSATGCTPIDFFTHLRMRRACELLRNRNLSVKETADLLGYDDPYYFSRIFKSVMGVAPREYRNRLLVSQMYSGSKQAVSGKETARYSPPPKFVLS